ncbi:hypothetical protein K437DRAFT_275759 [Tilletiaria anomala UBC 951]|uniref:Uncharacterized protein n=1 Tax=Tilletiaria anomala (strain ATCC 24038 / CBS 436.72 / UBC 951) TaxID=1037660 RepID=A0A066VET4_TILAU|nr:uncharacterized protein K437DRAFT_275759 [Tilletiaria anomala UBC 951]KDN40252.1 hypothetical protein K437DRAFT_275759 [Tilletiaria anomala UBC 951]
MPSFSSATAAAAAAVATTATDTPTTTPSPLLDIYLPPHEAQRQRHAQVQEQVHQQQQARTGPNPIILTHTASTSRPASMTVQVANLHRAAEVAFYEWRTSRDALAAATHSSSSSSFYSRGAGDAQQEGPSSLPSASSDWIPTGRAETDHQAWHRLLADLAFGAGVRHRENRAAAISPPSPATRITSSGSGVASASDSEEEAGDGLRGTLLGRGIAASMLSFSAAYPEQISLLEVVRSGSGPIGPSPVTAQPRLLSHSLWSRRYPGPAGEWLRAELGRRAAPSTSVSSSSSLQVGEARTAASAQAAEATGVRRQGAGAGPGSAGSATQRQRTHTRTLAFAVRDPASRTALAADLGPESTRQQAAAAGEEEEQTAQQQQQAPASVLASEAASNAFWISVSSVVRQPATARSMMQNRIALAAAVDARVMRRAARARLRDSEPDGAGDGDEAEANRTLRSGAPSPVQSETAAMTATVRAGSASAPSAAAPTVASLARAPPQGHAQTLAPWRIPQLARRSALPPGLFGPDGVRAPFSTSGSVGGASGGGTALSASSRRPLRAHDDPEGELADLMRALSDVHLRDRDAGASEEGEGQPPSALSSQQASSYEWSDTHEGNDDDDDIFDPDGDNLPGFMPSAVAGWHGDLPTITLHRRLRVSRAQRRSAAAAVSSTTSRRQALDQPSVPSGLLQSVQRQRNRSALVIADAEDSSGGWTLLQAPPLADLSVGNGEAPLLSAPPPLPLPSPPPWLSAGLGPMEHATPADDGAERVSMLQMGHADDPRETRRPRRLPSVTHEVDSAMRSVPLARPQELSPGWAEALSAVRVRLPDATREEVRQLEVTAREASVSDIPASWEALGTARESIVSLHQRVVQAFERARLVQASEADRYAEVNGLLLWLQDELELVVDSSRNLVTSGTRAHSDLMDSMQSARAQIVEIRASLLALTYAQVSAASAPTTAPAPALPNDEPSPSAQAEGPSPPSENPEEPQRPREMAQAHFFSQILSDSFFSGSEAERDFLQREAGAQADASVSLETLQNDTEQVCTQEPEAQMEPAAMAEGELVGQTTLAELDLKSVADGKTVNPDIEEACLRLLSAEDRDSFGASVAQLAARVDMLALDMVKAQRKKRSEFWRSGDASWVRESTAEGQDNPAMSSPTSTGDLQLQVVTRVHGRSLDHNCLVETSATARTFRASAFMPFSFRVVGLYNGDAELPIVKKLVEARQARGELSPAENVTLTRLISVASGSSSRSERLNALSQLSREDISVLRDLARRRMQALRAEEEVIQQQIRNAEQLLRLRQSGVAAPTRASTVRIAELLQDMPFPAGGVPYSEAEKAWLQELHTELGDAVDGNLAKARPGKLLYSRKTSIEQALERASCTGARGADAVVSLSTLFLIRSAEKRSAVDIAVFATEDEAAAATLAQEFAGVDADEIVSLSKQLGFFSRPGFAERLRVGAEAQEVLEQTGFGDPFAVERIERAARRWTRAVPRVLPIALVRFKAGDFTAGVGWHGANQMNMTGKVLTFMVIGEGQEVDLKSINCAGTWGRKSFAHCDLYS